MDRKNYTGTSVNEYKEYNCYAHDVLFGMCYEFIKPGQKLLDIGIGTGVSSLQFYRAGLNIYGLDSSSEMLDKTAERKFTEELRMCDISRELLPFADNYFDHVVCCGVTHFINDLSHLFSEVKRVLKKDGTFAFTFSPINSKENYKGKMTQWGIMTYRHSPNYIEELTKIYNLQQVKEQRLLFRGADKVKYNMHFSAIVSIHG